MVSRIAVLGLILLTASACSRMPNVPTAYSSLPAPTAGHDAALKAVPSLVAPAIPAAAIPAAAIPAAALPVIRIPGTTLAHDAERQDENLGPRVNPTDVLAASARARLAWQTLRPTELTRPIFVMNRDALARSVAETGTIGAGKPVAKVEAPSYDREAMMARLEKDGRRAAKPICSGC